MQRWMQKLTVAEARDAGKPRVGSVRLQGWIRTRRDSKGGFSFLELNDGSCLANVQIVADGNAAELRERDQAALGRLQRHRRGRGARPRRPRGRRPKSRPQTSIVHGWADPETYPLQKKRHSFEFLRTIAHLRPRTNTFGAIARVRNCVCRSIHDFFQEARLPLRPHADHHRQRLRRGRRDVPGHDARSGQSCRKQDAAVDYAQDFFDRPAYLTVSGQLEGEIFACALGKVYTFGPTFRAENSNTSRHLAEFWMVEPEMAFFELTDNMDLAEAFLKRIFRDVLAHCPEDMQFFDERIDKTCIEHARRHRRQRVRAAAVHRGGRHPGEVGPDVRVSRSPGAHDLQAEHERYLTETALQVAGDPVRLSADDQAVLHARQRRRQNGAGDGRAGAQRRRDHRRQPARRAARRARSSG